MAAKLIIADPDYNYVQSYEEELIKRFGDRTDVQIITQADYLANYFRVHRTIDILIIAREFYGMFVKEHDIGHLLVLDQEITLKMEDDGIPTTELKKFTSVEEEFEFIEESLKDAPMVQPGTETLDEAKKEAKVISVYSPVGGSGKSLVAFALGKKIKKLEEKVLIIGCDDLQSIGVYLQNRQHAPESLAAALKTPNEDTYWEVLKNISQEDVPCILPFEKQLSVLEIGTKELVSLVELIKSKGDFGYIILDLGSDMGETNRTLISISDICIVITEPNLNACRKLEKIVMNQDVFNVPKSLTISNHVRTDGIHLNPDGLFGSISAYKSVEEAMEDPLFYRLALEITE